MQASGIEIKMVCYGSYANMTERAKVRSIEFLACFIAIATAFEHVEGSGWQEKKEQE